MASAVTKSISLDHKARKEYKQESTVKERRNSVEEKNIWHIIKRETVRMSQETDWRKRRRENEDIGRYVWGGETKSVIHDN